VSPNGNPVAAPNANLDHKAANRAARVLIVDDERHNRQLLEVMLASEGFIFTTAASGQEALDLVARAPPDIILLDVMMPGMSGYQVAERIKADAATQPIPIIMITALGDHDAMMMGLAAGAGDFLTKPVNRAELCLRIKNLVRLKAFGDDQHKYSQMLEGEVGWRTADLVESERLYRSTFDAAPVGIVHVGLDGEWLSANQGLCELLGYAAKELRSLAVQNLIRSPGTGDESELFRQLAGGAKDRHVLEERPYRRKDGSLVWTRVQMSVHRDARRTAQHFILVIEDITERRALEGQVQQSMAHLLASEQRYRTLLDCAGDAISVLTLDGVVREVNRRWVDIVGLPREQLIGRHVREFARSGQGDENTRLYDEGVASPGVRSTPVEFTKPDGTTVLMEFSRTIIDIAGERLVLAIGRDVTEQRQLEKQLLQAQKLEVIGQLAGGIAHDFNNLLTAILGSSEMLLMDVSPDDPRRVEVLEIKKAGERAAGLTRQLLAFSRKQVLQPNVLNINEMIASMEPMLRRLIPAHINLVIALQQKIGFIKMDATQLEQIVVNLAINAADAMPGGGKLTIETANVRLDEHYRKHHLPIQPGEHILLAVSDTGVGMDEETSRRVFEPFFTTKDVGKGTGLGLATVYGIVKQSGGDIWVYSEPGHGSAFKIYLPREAAVAAAARKLATAAPATIRPGSETILLVEDDPAVRRLARLSLERYGYRVVEAANPKVALRLAAEFGQRIHLLLSDVIMPESDGPPLFKSLRNIHPDLRVLYMSGYADEAVVRHGIVTEGSPFLQKPFTPLTLSQKVRGVLDAEPPAGAAGADLPAVN
jgi:two-component system, cell cycle sensor histidine kinase and response regulator CckA